MVSYRNLKEYSLKFSPKNRLAKIVWRSAKQLCHSVASASLMHCPGRINSEDRGWRSWRQWSLFFVIITSACGRPQLGIGLPKQAWWSHWKAYAQGRLMPFWKATPFLYSSRFLPCKCHGSKKLIWMSGLFGSKPLLLYKHLWFC